MDPAVSTILMPVVDDHLPVLVIRRRVDGRQDRQVDAERLVGQLAALGDLLGQVRRRRLRQRGDEPQRTGIRHARNEFRATDPLHTALHDGMLDPERLGELRPYRHRGSHPYRTVQPDYLAVEHRVLHDVHGKRAVLVGVTEAGGMRHLLAQRGLRLLGKRAEQRRLEQTRRDGHHADELARQVAGDRQRHADHTALGCGVRGLTDLPLEGRDGCGVDDDAALTVDRFVLGDALGGQPQHVEGADQVDLDDLLESVERERAVLAQRLGRIADARAVDVDAQRAHLLGGVERRADGLGICHVGLDELGAVAELLDGFGTPEVDDDHRCAPVEQPLGGRQAETGGSSGDDGYGVFDLHLVRSFHFQSRRTVSMSVPGSPNGLGVDVALRENRGAGDGSRSSPSR